MKLLGNLILSFIIAAVIFFVALLYFGLSIEISIVIASFVLLIVGGVSLIGFDEFMMIFEGRPKTEGMTPEQKSAYEKKQAELKAEEDWKKQEKEREDPYGIKDMADRLRKGKRGI